MQNNRRGGNAWIGWLIFIFLVFGSRFLPPVANWLSQVTGLQISTPMLIVAIVALAVVGSIASSLVQGLNRPRSSNETHLPTGMPPTSPRRTMSPPRTPSVPAPPSAERLPKVSPPAGEQKLPGPPRFEPIIDPRVFAFGIIGLVIFGGLFFIVLLIGGSLP